MDKPRALESICEIFEGEEMSIIRIVGNPENKYTHKIKYWAVKAPPLLPRQYLKRNQFRLAIGLNDNTQLEFPISQFRAIEICRVSIKNNRAAFDYIYENFLSERKKNETTRRPKWKK